MRDILFRGKRVDNGEWIYGGIIPLDENCVCIVPPYQSASTLTVRNLVAGLCEMVIPETVVQYTGLTDKNGTKIFEGDIVRGIAYSSEWIGVIVWIDKIASFGLRHGHDIAWENCTILKRAAKGMQDEFTAEVIGNIHDNPELLEVAGND